MHWTNYLQINRWCEEAGGNIDIFYESKKPKVEPTKMDNDNPFWVAFKSCICDELYVFQIFCRPNVESKFCFLFILQKPENQTAHISWQNG